MVKEQELHVVFGVGEVGKATGLALLKRGKRVRFVSRRGVNPLAGQGGTEAVKADATVDSERNVAAKGATVVYDCTNPPYYAKWAEFLPPLTRGVLVAAESVGARLVQVGNLYMYGKVMAPMTEKTTIRPVGHLGQLRAMLAAEAMEAHAQGRLQVTIARASDFYGVTENAVIGSRAFAAIMAGRAVDVLGNPDKLHSYTYIPDLGEAMALLGDHPEASGRVWHVPTPGAKTTREIVEMAASIAGKKPKIRVVTRPLIALAGIFMPRLRGMNQMMYEFENDFVLDSGNFESTFNVRPTDLQIGLREAFRAVGMNSDVQIS